MVIAAAEADSLIEQLKNVNEQLLSLALTNLGVSNPDMCNLDAQDLNMPDLDAITDAIERRSQLVTRLGHLLRDSGSVRGGPNTPTVFRAALDQALEAGEYAVQRIVSLRQTIGAKYVQLNRMQAGPPRPDPSISCEM